MKKHLVLVGLPGAGKTTVGNLVAERLGAEFGDCDSIIVRKMQRPVSRVFSQHGGVKLRGLERTGRGNALGPTPASLSPRRGMMRQPGCPQAAKAARPISHSNAAGSHTGERGGATGVRPLLVGEDP